MKLKKQSKNKNKNKQKKHNFSHEMLGHFMMLNPNEIQMQIKGA